AVAIDQPPRRLEVAREELPRLLGVARRRQPREVDEVGEEDGHDAPLRNRGVALTLGRLGGERAAALAAELRRRLVRRPARGAEAGERRAALQAELAGRGVRDPAAPAVHA